MIAERMGPFNVLISSAGRRVALIDIFRRTLRGMDLPGEVFAADMSRLSSALHSADRAFLVPPCSSPEFVPEVLELCREHRVGLVIPTIDPELPAYALSRDRFRDVGTTVAISSPGLIDIASDKRQTHAWLVSQNFPTVRQGAVADVAGNSEQWPFPLVLKPRWGSASVGMAIAHHAAELDMATRGAEFVVETPAPGDEYTIDLLADAHGKCVGTVPRRRIEVRAGEVSKGVTARPGPLIELARCVCNALPGSYGPLTLQVFLDRSTGEMNVIEINPRLGGGFPLAWEAGANYPRRIIEEILDIEPRTPVDDWKDGFVMLRYDEGVFVDARDVGLEP